MARRTTVMNVDVNTEDDVNLIKDVRARSNACYKCGEMGHFQRDCKYDGDEPMDSWQEQDGSFDSYDPVVEKVNDQFSRYHPHYCKGYENLS